MRARALLLPLATAFAVIIASPALAVPFTLQVFQNGSSLGTFNQSTTWLGCSQADATTSCAGSSRTVGGLTLGTWNLFLDNDPIISAIIAVTNNTLSTQQYTLLFTLPVLPIAPSSLTSGSIQGGITDNNNNGATLTTSSFLYTALIDGVSFQTLYTAPATLTAPPLDSANLPVARFGFPNPPSLPGPAVATSIGIQLRFSLTAGDSASFTSNFVVEPVPEPSTALLVGLGLVGIAARRRLQR